MRLKPMLIPVALTIVSLFAVPGITWAASIEINQFLLNPSFETGTNGACPTSWTCGGSPSPGFAEYTPTAAQFTAGVANDGIPGIVPDGIKAANSPTGLAGSGTILQSTSATWVAGQQYTFTFWVGLPNKEPNGTDVVNAWPGTVRLYILSNGVADNLSGSGPIQFDIPSPGQGKWQQITETFTPGQNTGQSIGVEFFVSTTANNQAANFDITPVPEPATMFLGGLALVTLGFAARRRLFGR